MGEVVRFIKGLSASEIRLIREARRHARQHLPAGGSRHRAIRESANSDSTL
jgi:hypothetical protein